MLSFGANEDGNTTNLYGSQNEPSQWLHQSCKSEDNNKQELTEKNQLKTARLLTALSYVRCCDMCSSSTLFKAWLTFKTWST